MSTFIFSRHCLIYSLFIQGLFFGDGRALDLRLPKYADPGSFVSV